MTTTKRGANNSHFAPNPRQAMVRVTLECGHTVSMRLTPLSDKIRYGCSMGTGCGYRLRWVRWVCADQTGTNKTYVSAQDKPTEPLREL